VTSVDDLISIIRDLEPDRVGLAIEVVTAEPMPAVMTIAKTMAACAKSWSPATLREQLILHAVAYLTVASTLPEVDKVLHERLNSGEFHEVFAALTDRGIPTESGVNAIEL